MTYTLSPRFRLSSTADGGVLLDLNRGKYFALNRTAAFSVEQLLAGHTAATVADSIVNRVPNSEPATVARDVRKLVETLERTGVLTQR